MQTYSNMCKTDVKLLKNNDISTKYFRYSHFIITLKHVAS